MAATLQGDGLARPPSTLDLSLHADLGFLAERRRDVAADELTWFAIRMIGQESWANPTRELEKADRLEEAVHPMRQTAKSEA
jgi:hypothetical protein